MPPGGLKIKAPGREKGRRWGRPFGVFKGKGGQPARRSG